ncbi:uncharacterized protein LOC143206610 [Rhynchophorus ferrugineus]|uniref:uncharacterized protein LOC143206610 n=1 Tax=Rhynchophorus ferrugineus TaxID=354439 RepID=UPI003FCE3CBA
MSSAIISLLFVLFCSTLFVQGDELSCYSCESNDAEHCPRVTTDVSIYDTQKCTGSLEHVCARFSIDLLNGESITYRSCEPKYIGGTSDTAEFCQYHTGLFQPLIDNYLISTFECSTCSSFLCNT